MGTFQQWAQNYYDKGLSVLPTTKEAKACFESRWSEIFCKTLPTLEQQEYYINDSKFINSDMGLALGEASGLIAIDFDYSMPDSELIEDLVLSALPPSPVEKRGNPKRWTKFYRYNPDITTKHIARFGSGMIDVLSHGSITILPPSDWKDGKSYFWSSPDTLLDIDINELPQITLSLLSRFYEIADTENSAFKEILETKKGRHNLAVGYILHQSDVCLTIDDLISKVLTYDTEVLSKHDKGRYFSDKKYFKCSEYDAVKDLVSRVCEWKQKTRAAKGVHWEIGKPKRLKEQGKKASRDYQEFKNFFEFKYGSSRKDIVSDRVFFKDENTNKWRPIRNHIKVMQSEVLDINLSKQDVDVHLERWVQPIKPRLLVDIKKWDGKDRIEEMVNKLTILNIPSPAATDLIKEWCATIFKRIDDPLMNQNPMLILKGRQGVGKDTYIAHMFENLDVYYSEIQMSDNLTEVRRAVKDMLVAYIPEFDETHKVSIGNLKALISGSKSKMRALYAPDYEDIDYKVSYVSSMNFDKILRDYTGNRRFWIFDVDNIEWDYKEINKDQLVAQYWHLYKNDYKASEESHNYMKRYIKEQTPNDPKILLLEEAKYLIQLKTSAASKCRWSDISDGMAKISQKYGWKLQNLQELLRNMGYSRRDNNTTYYEIPIDAQVNLVHKDAAVLDFYSK